MAPTEACTYRVRHSPSWSFRWDNRTHIEDIMENSMVFSNQSSVNIHPEVKNSFIAPTEGHNSGDSHSDVLHRVKWEKSNKKMEASKLSKVDHPAHQSTAANPTLEAKSSKARDIVTVASDIKTSESLPSTLPPVPKADSEDPSSSRSHSVCIDPNSTREATQLPGRQLYRQTLDGNIPSLELLSGNSSAEKPSNSKLSACSNGMFAGQLQGGGQLAHPLIWWPQLKEIGGLLTMSSLAPLLVKHQDQMVHIPVHYPLTKRYASYVRGY